jgi:hypothetical protein
VRFAGPRLAGGNDDLVPVELRRGDPALGSALAWEQAQPLAPFPEASPFAGLDLDERSRSTGRSLPSRRRICTTRCGPASPTARRLSRLPERGDGLLVLVHVTANAEWSNLPLSGLFVEMLNRIVELAPAAGGQAPGESGTGPPDRSRPGCRARPSTASAC